MGKTVTNLSIVLGLATVAFAGYYLYTQPTSDLDFNVENQQTMESMLTKAQTYLVYSRTLDKISFDIEFFEDERFLSLRSFSQPVKDQPVGRSNPFDKAEKPNL